MMLTTPPVEPEPYRELMGPLSTSTRSTSSGLTSPRRPLMSVVTFMRQPSTRMTTESRPRPRMFTSAPQGESSVRDTPANRAMTSVTLTGCVSRMSVALTTPTPPGVREAGAATPSGRHGHPFHFIVASAVGQGGWRGGKENEGQGAQATGKEHPNAMEHAYLTGERILL